MWYYFFMKESSSFEHAVFTGEVAGPGWKVVNSNTGHETSAGDQDFGHTYVGREVRSQNSGTRVGYVEDYQHPADTPPSAQSFEVAYHVFDADNPYRK